MNKKFIITIDTEGDNLWNWKEGEEIKTENTNFLQRFQDLCDKYGFVPTWLVNWEMANDQRFVDFAVNNLKKDRCEIGMHLHAWNTPPIFELEKDETSGNPYLIEYPDVIMEQKIATMTDIIEKKFGKRPVVHRAGRWTMDDRYYKLLDSFGYIADCSVTPHYSWGGNRGRTPGIYGSDYRNEIETVSKKYGLFEVPVSTMWSHRMFLIDKKTSEARKKEFKHLKKGRTLWLRPNGKNLREMTYLIEKRNRSDIDFLEFMIHSSELMPGGSPTFKTENDVELLYDHMEYIFNKILKNYEGIGMEKYVRTYFM